MGKVNLMELENLLNLSITTSVFEPDKSLKKNEIILIKGNQGNTTAEISNGKYKKDSKVYLFTKEQIELFEGSIGKPYIIKDIQQHPHLVNYMEPGTYSMPRCDSFIKINRARAEAFSSLCIEELVIIKKEEMGRIRKIC